MGIKSFKRETVQSPNMRSLHCLPRRDADLRCRPYAGVGLHPERIAATPADMFMALSKRSE
jgi:hypothetical protein